MLEVSKINQMSYLQSPEKVPFQKIGFFKNQSFEYRKKNYIIWQTGSFLWLNDSYYDEAYYQP